MQIDDTDRRILRQMLAEPELATSALAARAGVTTATCWRRLEKLRAGGVIKGEQAMIDWRKMGWEGGGKLALYLGQNQSPRI